MCFLSTTFPNAPVPPPPPTPYTFLPVPYKKKQMRWQRGPFESGDFGENGKSIANALTKNQMR